jgi:hypothetical protein
VNGGIKYTELVRLGHEPMNLANALGRNARRTGSDLTTVQKEAVADIQKMTIWRDFRLHEEASK